MADKGAAAPAEKNDDQYGDVAFRLSDEERAAIADDTDPGAGGDDGGTGGPPSPKKADDKAAGDGSDEKSDGEAPAGDDATKTDEDKKGDEEDEIPRGQATTVQLRSARELDPKATERIVAIDAELDELDTKWENDQITQKEYAKLSRTLLNERSEKVADAREQELLRGSNQALAESDWNRSVAQFLDDNPEFKDETMRDALNGRLQALYADEKNIGASHQWYLQTAKRDALTRIRKILGGDEPDAEPKDGLDKPPSTRDEVKAQAAASAAARNALPKTLGDVPAASAADTGQDPYAKLDNLEGLELEQALAAMDENTADKYLRGEPKRVGAK